MPKQCKVAATLTAPPDWDLTHVMGFLKRQLLSGTEEVLSVELEFLDPPSPPLPWRPTLSAEEAYGKVTFDIRQIPERLVSFLYILLRDHLPSGAVDGIIANHVLKCGAKSIVYSSRHVESLAREWAATLTHLPLPPPPEPPPLPPLKPNGGNVTVSTNAPKRDDGNEYCPWTTPNGIYRCRLEPNHPDQLHRNGKVSWDNSSGMKLAGGNVTFNERRNRIRTVLSDRLEDTVTDRYLDELVAYVMEAL